MSLIYSLVARGGTVLAEYTENQGNFTTVTQTILDRIPNKDAKCTYEYGEYLFHFIRQNGIVYLVMADEQCGTRTPFAFLAQIRQDFGRYEPQAHAAIAYQFNNDFSDTLRHQMASFSRGGGSGGGAYGGGNEKLHAAKKDIEEVTGIMKMNIEKVLDRGEKIDLLVDKAENLNSEASRFQKRAVKLRKQMWWQNKRMCMILSLVLIVVCVIVGIIIWKST